MPTLTLLIFSRDSPDSTIALAKDLQRTADETVIVDSSSDGAHEKLIKLSEQLINVRIYRTIAVGVAEPFRQYGLDRCRGDWVLFMDPDERLSEGMKQGIEKKIQGGAHAYAIRRYEEAHIDGTKTDYFTWQVRLYKRRNTDYRGILHEQPAIHGKMEKIEDPEMYMLHVKELRQYFGREYFQWDVFERFSYANYNRRMLEYISRMVVPKDGDIMATWYGKLASGWMNLYDRITFRKKEGEVSMFDYFVMFAMRNTAYMLKEHRLPRLLDIRSLSNQLNEIRRLKADDRDDKTFRIAQIIHSDGLTKYLKFDDEKVVAALNKKYHRKEQGTKLLIKLIYDRYDNEYP